MFVDRWNTLEHGSSEISCAVWREFHVRGRIAPGVADPSDSLVTLAKVFVHIPPELLTLLTGMELERSWYHSYQPLLTCNICGAVSSAQHFTRRLPHLVTLHAEHINVPFFCSQWAHVRMQGHFSSAPSRYEGELSGSAPDTSLNRLSRCRTASAHGPDLTSQTK
jgi:hypothetical protein